MLPFLTIRQPSIASFNRNIGETDLAQKMSKKSSCTKTAIARGLQIAIRYKAATVAYVRLRSSGSIQ